MMMSKVKKKVLKDTEAYKARLEEIFQDGQNILFVHIELKQPPKKSTILELKEEFNEYKRKIKSAGYEFVCTYSKEPRFYRMFEGWQELGDMGGKWKGYKVVKWDLK